jgi:hypothetical protein
MFLAVMMIGFVLVAAAGVGGCTLLLSLAEWLLDAVDRVRATLAQRSRPPRAPLRGRRQSPAIRPHRLAAPARQRRRASSAVRQ